MGAARPRVRLQRHRLGESTRELHAPRRENPAFSEFAPAEPAGIRDDRRALLRGENDSVGEFRARLLARPILRRMTRYEFDVRPRLRRETASTREPARYPTRPGVIGSRREAEVAELRPEVSDRKSTRLNSSHT